MNAETIMYNALDTTIYKVYPQFAPQNESNPVVVYNVLTEVNEFGLKNRNSAIGSRFQVDIYSESYKELKMMKEVITEALYAYVDTIDYSQVIVYGSYDTTEEYVRRTRLDIKIWVS